MTAGRPGALQGPQQGQSASTSVAFNGTGNGYNPAGVTNPTTFTLECWFKASGSRGGQIIGLSSDQSSPTAGATDRLLSIDANDDLIFGIDKAGALVTVRYDGTAATWRTWHHVAATMNPTDGIRLYIDGVPADHNPAGTEGKSYTGYWRWGGGSLSGWPDRPAQDYFVGLIDEFAYYPSTLTAQTIARHYHSDH